MFALYLQVGCTNMKTSIFASGGYLSPSVLNYPPVQLEKEREKAIRKGSFLNASMTDQSRRVMMYQFEKYIMVRHPLERLVSAYRDKMLDPLLRKTERKELQYFEKLKQAALNKCEPQLYQNWTKEEVDDVSLNFTCFIIWLTKYGGVRTDDHFMMLVDNCQPCHMHYDFYGNFKSFVNDGRQILSKFTDDLSSFKNAGYYPKGNETQLLLSTYYSQLTPSLRKNLHHTIKLDLEFYHTLYPSDEQLTQDLLGLS